MTTLSAKAGLLSLTLLTLAAVPVRAAGRFSLSASGVISENSSGDSTIPIGTPWTFEIVYDTAAPDLDPSPTFGSYSSTSLPPALISFHYQAGGYEVSIDHPADFENSGIFVDFGGTVNSIDINVNAPAFFPPLGGGAVSFHADFNDFSARPIFMNDALPTDPAFSPDSFDEATVSLLPASGGVVSGSSLATFTVAALAVPVPLLSPMGAIAASALLLLGGGYAIRR